MSEIENRLRRRWESMPYPDCTKCDGEGKIDDEKHSNLAKLLQ